MPKAAIMYMVRDHQSLRHRVRDQHGTRTSIGVNFDVTCRQSNQTTTKHTIQDGSRPVKVGARKVGPMKFWALNVWALNVWPTKIWPRLKAIVRGYREVVKSERLGCRS